MKVFGENFHLHIYIYIYIYMYVCIYIYVYNINSSLQVKFPKRNRKRFGRNQNITQRENFKHCLFMNIYLT